VCRALYPIREIKPKLTLPAWLVIYNGSTFSAGPGLQKPEWSVWLSSMLNCSLISYINKCKWKVWGLYLFSKINGLVSISCIFKTWSFQITIWTYKLTWDRKLQDSPNFSTKIWEAIVSNIFNLPFQVNEGEDIDYILLHSLG